MNYTQLFDNILKKRSFLCVGLDPVLEKMPESCRTQEHPLFHFNKAIIDATAPYAVAYKPNCAFYEAYGTAGWEQFEQTVRYIDEMLTDNTGFQKKIYKYLLKITAKMVMMLK